MPYKSISGLFESNNIIWCAAHNSAQLFKRDHSYIFTLFQRVKRFVVNAILQKGILRNIILFHSFPKRFVVKNRNHRPFSLWDNYMSFFTK